MSHNPHDPGLKKAPQNQTEEDYGQIKSSQVTDRTMSEKDLPRGSETEARRKGNN